MAVVASSGERPAKRVLALLLGSVALLVFAGCGGGGSKTAATTASTGSTNSSSSAGSASSSTGASAAAVDACKLSDAEVQGIVGFPVAKAANPEPDSCEYDGTETDGSVLVKAFTYPSESDANAFRDALLMEKIPGVSGAFIDDQQTYGDAIIFVGPTLVSIALSTPEGINDSDSQFREVLVALIKKFA